MSDPDASMAALVENLQREDLNPLDEAEGLQRAIERFGLTQDALARALGKSRSHVANTMRLLSLPDSVRQDLRAGRLSAGHARALLAHPDPQAAARTVIARGLNVRQTEALAAAGTPPGPARRHWRAPAARSGPDGPRTGTGGETRLVDQHRRPRRHGPASPSSIAASTSSTA